MGKRDRKKRNVKNPARASGEEPGGGLLMSMRGGFKNIASGKQGPKTPLQKAWDILFWILILAALVFVFARRLGK